MRDINRFLCFIIDERESTPASASTSPSSQRTRRRSRDRATSRSLRADTPTPPELLEEMAVPAPLTQPEPDLSNESPMEAAVLPSADPELLQALGIFEIESDEWGPDIVDDLAKRWEPTLKSGLKKEARDELLKKYPVPKNCPLMKPPTLNPEISAVLNESAKNRDGRLITKQGQLGCAFTILGRTMSDILTKSISTPEVLKNLSDMGKILADSHYSETETRRSLISPMVDKSFIESFKDRKRDSHLFGEKLGEFIKSSRGIQKTGKLMQPLTSNTKNLNSKGAASHYHPQRPSRQSYRAGAETRAHQYQQYRRRVPFQPGLNNRSTAIPPAQTTSTQSAAPLNRKQAASSTYKRKQ